MNTETTTRERIPTSTRQNTASLKGHARLPLPRHWDHDERCEAAGSFGRTDDLEVPALAVLWTPESGYAAVSWEPPCDFWPMSCPITIDPPLL